MSLLVVGSVALDSVETASEIRERVLGGAASYFSVAASFLLPRVHLVGVVGEDFPEEHAIFLRGRGVDLSGLERASGRTFHWRGRYSHDLLHRTTIETELNVFQNFRPTLPELCRDVPYVFLANIHPEVQLEALDQVRAPRLVALDTMDYWIHGTPSELRRVLKRVDFLLLSQEEAVLLAEDENYVRAARRIQALGPRGVIVKRGDAGAVLFHEREVFAVPAFPLERVVDPTGAGDSFAGGFMAALARAGSASPADMRSAVVYGCVLGSFCVEDFSLDRFRRLGPADVETRFRAFNDLTRFGSGPSLPADSR